MLAYDKKMRKKLNIYSTKTLYAICKGVMLLQAITPLSPLPNAPNISQSSLKTPHPNNNPTPQIFAYTHARSLTQSVTHHKNTITSLSLLVWKKVKH